MAITRIESEGQAAGLAEKLLRPGRTAPAVVVSIAARAADPYVDVDELDKAVGDDCRIYVLKTGPVTFAFADGLPEGRQVYGGASRVYAVDNTWVRDQYASPLRFAFGPDKDGEVLSALIADAMAAAHAAGLGPGRARPARAQPIPVEGTVKGTVAGRALVDVGHTFPAVVYPDRLVPGLPAERLFHQGQRVTGVLDPDKNVLEIPGLLSTPQALAGLGVESIALARVRHVRQDNVELELHPQLAITVARDDPAEDLRAAYTPGEVLVVEVAEVDAEALPCSVQVLPPNFVDLALPVCLLAGGPAWLLPPEEPPLETQVGTAEAEDLPAAGAERDTDPLSQEVSGLQRQVQSLQKQVQSLESQLQQARTRTREGKQRVYQLEKDLRLASEGKAVATPGLFASEEDQFLHEVYVSWAERTTPADKEQYPWQPPVIGPSFIATLNAVQGIDRNKVVEVVADVACGRAETMPAREVHQLRTGPGGDDPPVTRDGGATCWRASLQQNTPSARRLHFWRLTDRSVELSSVRLHDDYSP